MNIPNILTSFRIVLVPAFALTFFSNSRHSLFLSILIFLTAGLTDILDGYIARKYNIVTKWGIVLDPLADKLMLLTVLTCLVIKGYSPIWVLIVIATKELFMIIAGVTLFHKDVIIPANIFGKLSSVLFYVSIFIISINTAVGDFFLYFAVFSALVALINYLHFYSRRNSKD